MKFFRLVSLFNGLILSSNVCYATLAAPIFSPYAALTINTHWDTQTQVDVFQALNVVHQNAITLPVIPEGLTAEGKEIIATANNSEFKFNKNIRAMDYGPAHGGDVGEYAIESGINLHQFLQEMYSEKIPQVLWQFIEVSPMIGANEVDTEQFTFNNADQLKQFAQKNQLDGVFIGL